MANVAALKNCSGFENEVSYVRCSYDFANDAGATGALVMADFPSKAMILKAVVHVETACTSGGSATVIIGTSDDTDAFMDLTSGAVANLVDDFALEEATAVGSVLDAADQILLTIGTAALTAGKINVEVQYVLVD